MQILIHTRVDDEGENETSNSFKNSTTIIMPTFYKLNNETCML